MSGPLISFGELAAALPSPTLLDVRWQLTGTPGAEEYAAGHIPGAVFVDLDRALAGPPGPRGRHPLPDAGDFGASMRAAGVSGSRPVVVYDAGGALSAARGWWLLRYFGHPDVRVLDGGLAAWRAAGHAVTRDVASVVPGDFRAVPGGMPVLDASAAARVAVEGVLLDARTPERFRGEHEPIDPVAGHIPGARNHPASENLDASGLFLPVDELRARFNFPGGAPVGAYCGSGVTAAQLVLALEAAGVRGALYPGSWSEWIADPTRPVATGKAVDRLE